ncbi:MAG: LamG-like jellyroll fold domain-containing protein [Fuerstiella sp.]
MTSTELQQLIDSLLEGDLNEADFLRLEAQLSVDEVARREYYDRVRLSLLLEHTAAEAALSDGSATMEPVRESVTARQWWKWAFTATAIVAALLIVVIGVQWNSLTKTRRQIAQSSIVDTPPSTAHSGSIETAVTGFGVISGQADAEWEGDTMRADGSLIPPGELRLRSGVVQLELFSGVSLVVEGDARFAVISPMEVAVSRGRVRARVPEPATGFRINTLEGEVVDLGTEFAMNVTPNGSEVHVLDGEIEWRAAGASPLKMTQGEVIRQSRDGQRLTAGPSTFVGIHELRERLQARQTDRLRRWQQSSERQRQDSRLVAYYRVAESDLSTRRLPNLALERDGISSNGAIVAAAPASDRWGQTRGALDFSPAGSRVRLSVPGEHRSLTLLCWVKINSLDRWYNSLFLTDGHEEGEPHWQIMDDGRLFFSVKKRDTFDRSRGEMDKHVYYSPPFWDSSLSGQWLMIATVYDVDAMKVTHFLNGDVLSEEAIPPEYLVETVRIGNASLCNWDLPSQNKPRFAVRNLNGSLDEFALYDAALSTAEIRKLYNDGRP